MILLAITVKQGKFARRGARCVFPVVLVVQLDHAKHVWSQANFAARILQQGPLDVCLLPQASVVMMGNIVERASVVQLVAAID